MTERLYYRDPYLTVFVAVVQDVVVRDGRQIVFLDRTAFYPSSGGQPCDVGTLDAARVVDVMDEGDRGIAHVVEGSVPSRAQVQGVIDWVRRFDHMQQHTGQHVLSAAFEALLKARTESFHLGAEASTIDLSREVSPPEIARVEDDANRIVWENRPVNIRFADAAEAAKLPLRKDPGRQGMLRVIEVEGYDLSACGGTHVSRTGAIGIIAVSGWERFRGGTRVEFVCGGRALRRHRRLRDIFHSATRLLSVNLEELPAGIERIQEEGKDARRRLKDAHAQLAVHQADALAAAADGGVVVSVLDGWDQNGLKAVATALAARGGCTAALVSAPPPCSVVLARSVDVGVDCGAILKQAAATFGGKGGGRPDLAQGGGFNAAPAAVAEHLRELLRASPL